MYIIDEKGRWKVQGSCKMLIEPSESYLAERELEEQQRLEQELLDSLIPTEKEVLMAEVELNTINLLMEVGLV